MSKVYEEKGVVVAEKPQKSVMARVIPATLVASVMAASVPAQAAVLDLSGLNTELEGIKTAVVGIFATALLIGVAIIGWKWAKRALFSI